jgi:hypothetical protein
VALERLPRRGVTYVVSVTALEALAVLDARQLWHRVQGGDEEIRARSARSPKVADHAVAGEANLGVDAEAANRRQRNMRRICKPDTERRMQNQQLQSAVEESRRSAFNSEARARTALLRRESCVRKDSYAIGVALTDDERHEDRYSFFGCSALVGRP